jgi:hypothetical protein
VTVANRDEAGSKFERKPQFEGYWSLGGTFARAVESFRKVMRDNHDRAKFDGNNPLETKESESLKI